MKEPTCGGSGRRTPLARKAREVVRKAHRKAFRVSSMNYRWHAWRVHSDLSGNTDKYRAKRGDARVRWVF